MINLIPKLIKERGYSLSDLHSLMCKDPATRLSWPALHRLANENQITLPNTRMETLEKIAITLGVSIDDLYQENNL